MATRDVVGLHRRWHVRRQLDLPSLSDLVPDIDMDLDSDSDEETEGRLTTDDEGPAPPSPAAPFPAAPKDPPTPPAINPGPPGPAAITAAPEAAPEPLVQTITVTESIPSPSTEQAVSTEASTVFAAADSLPTTFTTVTRPRPIFSSNTDTSSATPSAGFTEDPDSDGDDDRLPFPPPPPNLPETPTASITATNTNDRPALIPTDQPAFAYSDEIAPATKTAITAVVSIIAICIFCGIVYCLLRFCPPVRDRWTAWRIQRYESRLKRLGMLAESPLPAVVLVHSTNGRPRNQAVPNDTPWASGGLGVRNITAENANLRPPDDAHLRPPSYRTFWTGSGGSWVANGFRLPSQRMDRDRTSHLGPGGQSMRWSDRSLFGRGRFMGRGTRADGSDNGDGVSRTVSSISGGGLIADGMRPPQSQTRVLHIPPPVSAPSRRTAHTRQISRLSDSSSSISSRNSNSNDSNSSSRSRSISPPPTINLPIMTHNPTFLNPQPTTTRNSSQRSRSSQAAFSTHARISDMSSLSAGTRSHTFAPVPQGFRFPVNVGSSLATNRRESRGSGVSGGSGAPSEVEGNAGRQGQRMVVSGSESEIAEIGRAV